MEHPTAPPAMTAEALHVQITIDAIDEFARQGLLTWGTEAQMSAEAEVHIQKMNVLASNLDQESVLKICPGSRLQLVALCSTMLHSLSTCSRNGAALDAVADIWVREADRQLHGPTPRQWDWRRGMRDVIDAAADLADSQQEQEQDGLIVQQSGASPQLIKDVVRTVQRISEETLSPPPSQAQSRAGPPRTTSRIRADGEARARQQTSPAASQCRGAGEGRDAAGEHGMSQDSVEEVPSQDGSGYGRHPGGRDPRRPPGPYGEPGSHGAAASSRDGDRRPVSEAARALFDAPLPGFGDGERAREAPLGAQRHRIAAVAPPAAALGAGLLGLVPARRAWSDEEERQLISAYQRFGPKWEMIRSECHFRHRTGGQLKDKFRNLVKAGVVT